jgi:prepilin-type N-terminal cleavage/methylation domain-containing protein
MRPRRSQAGFTLTELMVVVTIISVLVTMAIVYMRPRVRPVDVANRVGDLVREGGRRAVALGPVRANVAAALGSKARTRITAALSAGKLTFTLWRLQEDSPDTATTAQWKPLESYEVDPKVLPDSFRKQVGDHSTGLITDWTQFTAECKPEGTCDARTVFFQAAIAGPPAEQYASLSILPLGGAIATRTDWN